MQMNRPHFASHGHLTPGRFMSGMDGHRSGHEDIEVAAVKERGSVLEYASPLAFWNVAASKPRCSD